MNSTSSTSCQSTAYTSEERALLLNTVEILNQERQTILFEVLKCDICLELPKGKQVRICEKGHHFCFTCHKKIKMCGICRGVLLDSRNFVVEQLVTKLGPVLGLRENDLPIHTPSKPIPGSFQCRHNCRAKMPSSKMLSHLRLKHSKNFKEKVVCNPYSNRFSLKYNMLFSRNNRYIYSVFVADLGLCTVEAFFAGLDFFGCVWMLVDKYDLPQFKYQLVVKVPTPQMVFEYGITDCTISHYSDDRESTLKQGNLLKIKSDTFLEHIKESSVINVFFSVWRESKNVEEEKPPVPSISCPSEILSHMENDRKARRNRKRNLRRKRLKTKLDPLSISSETLSFENVAF